jgi:hypothetical protein
VGQEVAGDSRFVSTFEQVGICNKLNTVHLLQYMDRKTL